MTTATVMITDLANHKNPGDFLSDVLEERSWTQSEFAEILGRPVQFVSEIVGGKKVITRESAAQIAAATGVEARFWLSLQDRYLLAGQRSNTTLQRQLEDVRLRAQLATLAPISALRRRHILTPDDPREQAAQLRDLFEIESIYDSPHFDAVARRSNESEGATPTQMAWLFFAKRVASTVTVGPYDPAGVAALAPTLSRVLRHPHDFRTVPQLLATVGVRAIHIEALPGSKIDAAAFMHDGSPSVVLSGRGQRLDKVLFALLHELAHLHLGHLEQGAAVIDELAADGDAREREADRVAGNWALPAGVPPVPNRVSAEWVKSVANELGVNPIVLIGRLQKDQKVPWRTALVRGAPTVTNELADWPSAQ